MRIVSGKNKGARLNTPKSNATRPTSDRVREAIFNKLEHSGDNFDWSEMQVLDLFAGTGALGLEALSRGASFTLFIETAIEARGIIRRNIEQLGYTGQSKLSRRDATKLGPLKRLAPFNLVFIDPPYERSLGERALQSALEGGWIAGNAMIILEESKRAEINWPTKIQPIEQREFGDTHIHFATYELG